MNYDPDEKLLRSKLARYLLGRMSLKAFREWLIPASWGMADAVPTKLQDLVYDIELRIIEYTNGHWTEDELKEKLRPFVTSFEIDRPLSAMAGYGQKAEAASRAQKTKTRRVSPKGSRWLPPTTPAVRKLSASSVNQKAWRLSSSWVLLRGLSARSSGSVATPKACE